MEGRLMKGSYYVKTRGKKARKYFIEFLEKNGFRIGTDSVFSREEILDSILPVSVDLDSLEYDRMGNTTCAAAASTIGAVFTMEEFLDFYESVNGLMIV